MARSKLQIGQRLGTGGLAEVHEVTVDGRRAVIKTLSAQATADQEAITRLRHEGKVTGALQHPNIRALIEQDDRSLVLEHLDLSLADVLRVAGSLPVDAAVYIISELLRALDYVHRQGRIHRDIKTANVLLTMDGAVKLADFEISKELGSPPTTRLWVRGTPGYMSPEQSNGAQLDERSDVFSAGIVLYELLTGTMPFGRTHETMLEGLYGPNPPAPAESHRPELAQREPLLAALGHMLERSRAARCPSAATALEAMPGYRQGRAELVTRLAELQAEGALGPQVEGGPEQPTEGGPGLQVEGASGEPPTAAQPTTGAVRSPAVPAPSRRPLLLAVGLALLLVGAAAGLPGWLSGGSPSAAHQEPADRSDRLLKRYRFEPHYPGTAAHPARSSGAGSDSLARRYQFAVTPASTH